MIFISTCSQDVTTDFVVKELGAENVLRFDIDRTNDFAWDFHRDGFRVADKTSGREITEMTLTSFYLRKPMYFDFIDIPKHGCVENWRREEIDELFADFFRECQARNLTALVHSLNGKYGKFRQLLAAKRHFRVAPWHFFHGETPEELKRGRWVVKSMTSTPLGEGKIFFVRQVNPCELDTSYPWFVQEMVDGEEEVTVVYVDGECYAASAPRAAFDGEDSRKSLMAHPRAWPRCELSEKDKASIRGFMSGTGYRFGRFDLIRKDGELWFLELNPNGQWAWLDERNENGLVTLVADAIRREDRAHRERPSRRGPAQQSPGGAR